MKLTNTQRRVAHAASSDDSRPVLTGAHIANGEITAGDGFMLVKCPIDDDSGEEWLIPAKSLLAVPGIPGSNYYVEIGKHADDEVRITGRITVLAKLINNKFPSTVSELASTIPEKEQPPMVIGFSPTLLRKLLKVVGNELMLKLRIRGENTCAEFQAGDISGLIMPMHTDGWDDHGDQSPQKEEVTSTINAACEI